MKWYTKRLIVKLVLTALIGGSLIAWCLWAGKYEWPSYKAEAIAFYTTCVMMISLVVILPNVIGNKIKRKD